MAKKNLDTNKSQLHRKCMDALRKAFPNEIFKENVFIKIDGKDREFDCQMVKIRAMIEFHGKQHYESNKFFHKEEADFRAQKRRDAEKALWCICNDYSYVVIPYTTKVSPKTLYNLVCDEIMLQMENEIDVNKQDR